MTVRARACARAFVEAGFLSLKSIYFIDMFYGKNLMILDEVVTSGPVIYHLDLRA